MLLFLFFALQRRNQTRKQASKHELLTFGSGVVLGGALRPPQPPPRATKSALHPRHPRLPRNQYFEVNSPVQNFLTKQICFLYRLYLSIYLSIDPFIFLSLYLSICSSTSTKYYTCHEICKWKKEEKLKKGEMEPGVVMECETDAPRCGGFNGQKLLLHLNVRS